MVPVFSALAATILIVLFAFAQSAEAQVRAITFPVQGAHTFRNDFSEPRDGGAREHLGIDIISAKMTPVVAVADGTISFIAIPQPSWGYSITVRDSEGYTYRYLHLNNDTPGTDDGQGGEANAYAAGLKRGSAVTKGQVIGWVGDSGNAESTVSHLHFEIRGPDRTNINPYDTLMAASGNGAAGQSAVTVTHATEATPAQEEQFLATRDLREGMTDKDIATLHAELKTLGYYTGALSETYTSMTREAVRTFQNDKAVSPTGIADVLTRRLITSAAKAVAPASPPAATAPSTQSGPLKEGAQGDAVIALQTRLKALGYFTSDITGYFGPITKQALMTFQGAVGLEQVGFVGPATRAALDAPGTPILTAPVVPTTPATTTPQTSPVPPAATPSSFTTLLQVGSRGEEVRRLQIALKAQGHFNEETTGYFGTITRAAVMAFQTAQNLEAVGFVGPKTRAALNAL
jgi:peptidoglycan hydrolase-like protein with peptidoglycan-binding domain